MESKDLRIGNIVSINGVELLLTSELFCLIVSGDVIKPKPIPLTEEWHNKFGVKINGFDSFEYVLPRKNNISLIVVFSGDYVFLKQNTTGKPMNYDIVSVWNKDLTKRDMYVHEWQNLFHSLTGEELTFEEQKTPN